MRCQHPVTLAVNPPTEDTCDKPAVVYTDDLHAVHYLCQSHCDEAATWNTFQADPL